MRPDPAWNDTRLPYPAGQSVHGVVSQVAAERPNAVALIDRAERTTYQELERASDAYAHLLRGAGVRPGDVVPVLLPRSTELVVVILGLLKAGAAYAVLDERWSDARLGEVVAELGAGLLVGGDRPAGAPVERWTPPGVHAAGRPDRFVPAEAAGGDPCCVFVTSGTTGRPKAVLSPHRATVRLFRPGASFALFDERTVKPLAAPPPWDGFTLELWSVLLNGGTSVVVREPYLTPQALRRGVREHGVNAVFLSSGLFNLFVDEDPGAFEGVRQVMSGGERLSVPHVREFLRRYPDVPLINGYGPVESTVVVTAHRVAPADCERPDGVPIGRPVPDTAVHVLDGTRPCAVGERGELCVSGDGLALGYLGSPELTAERFPVVEIDGEPTRIYRTGDLARWDDDGVLHYLGRLDRQVKIRGHRVEPAEVERQIERILSVRRCVALPRRGPDGAVAGLVAFCVPATSSDRLLDALGTLRDVLVHYHLPDAVVSVDAIPLTARGKVDETALLALLDTATPAPAPSDPGRPAAGPNDPLTGLVARVYAEVLGRVAVPAGGAFDELGGSSLDAGRVCARLTTELRRPVPVARLLDLRTAEALAHWLREHPAAPLPEGETDGAVPLTPLQANFLARYLRDPDDRMAHCVGVWLADGPVDADALAGAVAETHRRHEALRAEYRGSDVPTAHAGDVPAPRPVVLPKAATEAAAIEAVRAALDGPLDITRGRVWRLALAPVRGGGAAIGYVVHHIAFDGWSEAVLARDLSHVYASIIRGGGGRERPPAATLARARALWDAQRADAPVTSALLAGRVTELRGTPELPLPTGPTAGQNLPPDRVEHALPAEAAAAVRKAAAAGGCSEFTVLLAGYARALSVTTGQDDLAVVVPVAQRLDREMERAVGCHVNMVGVRFRNAAQVTVAEAVPPVRAALSAQYVEFGELIGELIGELRAAMPSRPPHAPIFQTNFAYQNVAPAALDLPGVRTRLFRPPYQGLPTPLQTEVWPDVDGGLRLVVNFLPGAVDSAYAARLADAFAGELASVATW
ncbi:amino acid adenylation domain-containing protein [Spirillospora sp. NPDC050679]